MSRSKKNKKSKGIQQAANQLVQNDPLQYPIKRGKVAQKHVERIIPTRQRSAYGHLHRNWIGAGMLTHTLRAIYTSPEPLYAQCREELKVKGFVRRPQELDFDILAVVEGAFPDLISISDIARRLNRAAAEITPRLLYLRDFVASLCGISVLRDGKGNVGIADAALWMDWHNRMAKQANGIRESQERHGLSLTNVVKEKLVIKEEYPGIQPFLLGFDEGETGAVAHD